MINIDSLKGEYKLVYHNNFIVAYGKRLIVFNKIGNVIFERRDLKNILKVGFVSDSEIIVGAGKDYFVISLTDGRDVCVFNLPNRTYSFPRFIISKTSGIIYDLISKNGLRYLVRFELGEKTVETKCLDNIQGAISDMAFDHHDTLCMLITVYENLAGEDISANSILYEHFYPYYEGKVNTYWKAKWNLPHPQSAAIFLDGTDLILTNDLTILDLNTGDQTSLLQEQDKKYGNPYSYLVDDSGKYVNLIYHNKNVILDKEQKIVALEFQTVDYLHGCIIDGEYWRITNSGLEKHEIQKTGKTD